MYCNSRIGGMTKVLAALLASFPYPCLQAATKAYLLVAESETGGKSRSCNNSLILHSCSRLKVQDLKETEFYRWVNV